MARAANIPATASPPKRGRGRPRATPAAAAEAKAAAVSKPRGRPPKARTAAAAEPKKSTVLKPTASSAAKRNVVVDEEEDDMTDDEIGSIVVRQKTKPVARVGRPAATTTKSTGRATKVTKSNAQIDSDDDDELAQPEIPKRKVGRPATKPVEKESSIAPEATAPRPRGRPRLNAAKAPAADPGVGTQRKTTKTRTTASTSESTGTAPGTTLSGLSGVKSSFLKEPAKKKKVTFQDLIDSDDDIPVVAESVPAKKTTKPAATQSGLKAKPVRKATGTGRGRKPAAAKETVQPLSPKKATQVAKSTSHAGSDNPDDDELDSAKTEDKPLVKSPVRHSENTVLASPIKRVNFAAPAFSPRPKASDDIENNENAALKSRRSIEFGDARFMASPARRLASSPFHFTMKESPRRTLLLNRDQSDLAARPESAATQASPLKVSPKKGLLFKQPTGKSPNSTPFKLSLLKSPAKRVCSPFKLTLSPEKSRSSQLENREGHVDAETDVTPSHCGDGSPRPTSVQRRTSIKLTANVSQVDFVLEDPFIDAPAPVGCEENPMVDDEETPEQEYAHMEVQAEADEEDIEDPVEPLEMEVQEHTSHEDFEVDEVQEEYEETEVPQQVIEDVPMAGTDGNDNVVIEEIHLSSPSLNLGVVEEREHLRDNHGPRESLVPQRSEGPEEEEEQNEETNDMVEFRASPAEEDQDLEDDLEGVAEEHARPSPEPDTDMQEGAELHQSPAKVGLEEEQHEYEEVIEQLPAEESMDVEDAHDDAIVEDDGIASPHQDTTAFEIKEDAYDTESPEVPEVIQTGEDEEPFQMPEAHLEDQENMSPATHQTGVSSPISELRMISLDSPASHHVSGAEQNMDTHDEPESIQPSPAMPLAEQATYEPREEDDAESDTDPVVDTMLFNPKRARRSQVFAQPATPGSVRNAYNEDTSILQEDESVEDLGFTPLAAQLSEWKASTPVESQARRPRRRGFFSLAGNSRSSLASTRKSTEDHRYRLRKSSSTFRRSSLGLSMLNLESLEDDQEVTRASLADIPAAPSPVSERGAADTHDDAEINSVLSEVQVYSVPDKAAEQEDQYFLQEPEEFDTDELVHSIQESLNQDTLLQTQENIETWDENRAPEQEDGLVEPLRSADPTEEDKENDEMATFSVPSTPNRGTPGHLRTVHTVSRVPLRPEGEVSPLKVCRKRARSLSSGQATRASPRIRDVMTKSQTTPALSPRKSPRKHSLALRPSESEESDQISEAARPEGPQTSANSRRVSSPVDPFQHIPEEPQALKGVVAFVDVHTTEGEDASGIFIELLTQMGARCVKSWGWNPRASLSPVDGAEPRENKIGITHVIYKDGGVRTLEKVRQAGGLVKCVGVAWVLDCERENKWLDEGHYLVDSSIIPRGGAKRRKSMQPRNVSNVNGTLVKADGPGYHRSSRVSGVDRESVQEFIRLTPSPAKHVPNYRDSCSTPARDNFSGPSRRQSQQPNTPGQSESQFNFDFDPSTFSPTTPYYLSKGAKLIQQTCPPKQTREGLFPITGRIEDESSSRLRAKLEAARRKSLAFKPKRESPLKR